MSGREFANTEIKIRNPKLGNDHAWQEAQAVMEDRIEGWPFKYGQHLAIIRQVFDARRDAFLGKHDEKSDSASQTTQKLVAGLSDEEQDLIAAPLVWIRNFFGGGSSSSFRPRRW